MIYLISSNYNTKSIVVVIFTLSTLIVFIVYPQPSQAGENRFSLSLSLEQEYDSNARLEAEDEIELHGQLFNSSTSYSYSDGRNNFRAGAKYSSRKYNFPEFDSDTGSVNLDYRKLSESSQISLTASHFLESLNQVETEFDESGIITEQASEKKTNSLSLGWQKSLNIRNALNTNTSVSLIRFDGNNLNDYDLAGLQLFYRYIINDLTTFTIQSSNRFQQTDFDTETLLNDQVVDNFVVPPPIRRVPALIEQDTFISDLQLGLDWRVSETMSINASAGQSFTNISQNVISDIQIAPATPIRDEVIFGGENKSTSNTETQSYLLSLNYDHLEKTSLTLNFSREIEPSSGGSTLIKEDVQFSLNQKISEKQSTSFSVSYGKRRVLNTETIPSQRVRDRDLISLNSLYRARLTLSWLSTFSLIYRQQEFEDQTSNAPSGFEASLKISYQPKSNIW